MFKLGTLSALGFAAFAIALPTLPLDGEVFNKTVSLALDGPSKPLTDQTMIVRAFPEAIDELSSYVVTLRMMSILALQDYNGEMGRKTLVYDVSPYNLVKLEVKPTRSPTVTRKVVVNCLFSAIEYIADNGFTHIEFLFVDDDEPTRPLKVIYTKNNPGNKKTLEARADVVEGDDVTATRALDLGAVVTADFSYINNGRTMTSPEVWLITMSTLKVAAMFDKDEQFFHSRVSEVDIDANCEIRGVGGGDTPPGFTALGLITAMWNLPRWMVSQGRLKDVKGVVKYDGSAVGEVVLKKGQSGPYEVFPHAP